MVINKAFRFKLRPNEKQESSFRQFAGATRWVWNRSLADRNLYYEQTGKSLSYNEQFKRLTELKRDPETKWLNGIHSQVLQEPIKNLHKAFDNYFRMVEEGTLPDNGKPRKGDGKPKGFPRFKSKKRTQPSFTYPQGIKVDENQVYLPKIGWVRFHKSQEVEGTIKRATISKKVSGWYISIIVELEIEDKEPPQPTEANSVGIDVGFVSLYATSDRDEVEVQKTYRKWEKKLAKAQRDLSRKEKGSNRYKKQKCKVDKIHEKIANIRRDRLHKESRKLVDKYDAIFVEDLNVDGIKNALNFGKSASDAGLGMFFHMLEYKSLWSGTLYYAVDRFFPSTKLHWKCGTLNELTLADRTFACQGCGKVLDRDFNSADNIKYKGLLDCDVLVGQPGTKKRSRTDGKTRSAGTSG